MRHLEDFTGDWQLRRKVTDRLHGQDGQLQGTASFASLGDARLRYTEVGTLRLAGGAALEARRSYFWRFDAGRVEVTFENDAPFHAFDPIGQAGGTDHLCGEDLYQVEYDFTAWPSWRATWHVVGPRKDYISVSDYLR